MAHHAYVYTGDLAAGIAATRAFAETLGLSGNDNPDIALFEYGLFSVDDARRVGAFAVQAPSGGEKKLVAIAAGRLFHEAQNALLKLFEEPTEGTTLVLIVPAEGMILPTLRSRLLPLPHTDAAEVSDIATEFLGFSKAEREKYVTKLIARSKSDKDTEKQAARLEAVSLISGITRRAHTARKTAPTHELDLLLADLDRFAPILHERSAPLKLIFEHLLIVLPQKL